MINKIVEKNAGISLVTISFDRNWTAFPKENPQTIEPRGNYQGASTIYFF
ncbi:MAG: hypothetical protein F6J90_34260 [Moorea sp. SIOASIH]|nr:hypothetical protein [Moorena sp. SIOASIH]NEO92025.1 hypothetical protein [Moorena sp. SIO3G5]